MSLKSMIAVENFQFSVEENFLFGQMVYWKIKMLRAHVALDLMPEMKLISHYNGNKCQRY